MELVLCNAFLHQKCISFYQVFPRQGHWLAPVIVGLGEICFAFLPLTFVPIFQREMCVWD